MFNAISINENWDLDRLLTTDMADLSERLDDLWARRDQEAIPHIAYAALWERAGAPEVFRRVIERHRFDKVPPDVGQWMDTTMRLWYSGCPASPLLCLTLAGEDEDDAAVRAAWYRRVVGALAGSDDDATDS